MQSSSPCGTGAAYDRRGASVVKLCSQVRGEASLSSEVMPAAAAAAGRGRPHSSALKLYSSGMPLSRNAGSMDGPPAGRVRRRSDRMTVAHQPRKQGFTEHAYNAVVCIHLEYGTAERLAFHLKDLLFQVPRRPGPAAGRGPSRRRIDLRGSCLHRSDIARAQCSDSLYRNTMQSRTGDERRGCREAESVGSVGSSVCSLQGDRKIIVQCPECLSLKERATEA